jgi:surfeit locus 1 family protein
MPRRNVIAAVLAVVVAAACVRLGLWQLRRLAERRARNSVVSARLAAPPVALAALPADTAAAHYRRVRVEGRWDFDHEIALTGRSRQGSPGVYLVTPLIPDDSGRAVLVNRGWVYSPDAATVDFARWHAAERGSVVGYVEELAPAGAEPPRAQQRTRAWRRLDAARLARELPYPIAPFYIVALATGEGPPSAPVRLQPPDLGEGPHKSYAVQWFSFAAIAVIGVAVLIWQDARGQRADAGSG